MIRSTALCSTSLLCFLSVACGYDNGNRHRVDPVTVPETAYGSIDTGQVMTDLTTGTGVFVEYAAGGNWKMQVSCDTAVSHQDCYWDIFAYTSAGGPIYSSQAIDLEGSDVLTVQSDGQLHLATDTSSNLDGVSFVTDKGAPVTFDLALDGAANPEKYFFYVSGGALVDGAASPIIELTPTEP